MNRRKFLETTGLTSAGLALSQGLLKSKNQLAAAHAYNLKYAPHQDMFQAHAGEDIVAQLNFMADVNRNKRICRSR